MNCELLLFFLIIEQFKMSLELLNYLLSLT